MHLSLLIGSFLSDPSTRRLPNVFILYPIRRETSNLGELIRRNVKHLFVYVWVTIREDVRL